MCVCGVGACVCVRNSCVCCKCCVCAATDIIILDTSAPEVGVQVHVIVVIRHRAALRPHPLEIVTSSSTGNARRCSRANALTETNSQIFK